MSPRKPLLIEDPLAPVDDPASAPPPPEEDDAAPGPNGRAMQLALRAAGRRLPLWARLGWSALGGLVLLGASVWAWDFVTGLMARVPILGALALALLGIVGLAALGLAAREIAALRRLRRLDALRARASAARLAPDSHPAAHLAKDLMALYAPRPDMRWPCARLADTLPDQLDGPGKLDLTETTLLAPLDKEACREIEAAARQVALLTALIPLALVDMLAALATNLRMIRRIAEIYGGRAGGLGSLRLARGVILHLLATGAVAVGEDMVSALASGSMLSKLSRRFGEGVVNGALTARLGIAALEVCRPMPFHTQPRPSTSAMMRRAVSGLFDSAGQRPG
ncbi:MAG: TIGR01620 family protein [Roseinatronobacter sp.]|jgi:putative membrane protein|nr:TIGR01620 family protein [Roseinatronobacter sp.]